MAVRYIDWSYWLELSGGSRGPMDAAWRIRDGFEAFRVRNDGFLDLADELRQGIDCPRLIVVSAVAEGADVVPARGEAACNSLLQALPGSSAGRARQNDRPRR